MVGHVYFRTKMSKTLSDVYIATCDQAIGDYADSIGAKWVMTKDIYREPPERVSEATINIEAKTGKKIDIVVMVQGDEPMVFPEMIDVALEPMIKDPSIQITNLMAPIKTREEHDDPNCPKVVVDPNNFAMYFSREPIPSWKKGGKDFPMWKQVCIIPFRRDFLLKFNTLPAHILEKTESVGVLRAMENGYKVKMVPEDYDTYCVDTSDDLKKVEKLLAIDPLVKQYLK